MIRHSRGIVVAAVLGGGLATALLAHAILQCIQETHALGSAYLEHDHSAVGPAALVAALLLVISCTGYLVRLLEAGGRIPLLTVARTLGSARLHLPVFALFIVGAAALGGMESLERLVAHDSDSFLSAYSANPGIGFAIIAVCAVVISVVLRSFARWLATATHGIIAFFAFFLGRRKENAVTSFLSRTHVRAIEARLDPVRIGPNRAPPFLLA